MSLSYERLNVVQVRDPRTILENKRDYAVLRAGSQTTFKQFTTTSVSQSSIQFSCPPPSGGVIIDRKQYFLLPIRLTFIGQAPVGQLLLNPGQDAPRAFPISSSIDTLQVSINNQSVSINMADIIHPLLHFNTCTKLSEREYSMTPSLLDQAQSYSSLFGTNRSPLSFYGDSVDQAMMPRGGFPFTIVSNTNTSAVVDMVCCEPLFLSPFYWGHGNSSGFYNVNTMDFNITFLGNAGNRMWSHDAVSSGVPTNITSVSAQFSNFQGAPFSYSDNVPLMLFQYITPNETQVLPFDRPITYPYFDVQRFPTDSQNAIAAGSQTIMNSNNIQLNSIPRRMYVFMRERNADLYSTPNNPDTFFSIENISVQFMNKNGLLASANKRQLYEMSVKNHCALSWTQWSGDLTYLDGSFGQKIGTVGSLLCIEFATDIGLDSLDAPGKLGQYMLQVNVTGKNNSNRNITPSLYVIVVSEGTFTIEGLGKASTNIGVISSEDILNAQQNPFVNYKDVEHVNGGNFLSGVKDFGKLFLDGLKRWDDRAGRALDTLMGDIAPTVIKNLIPGRQLMNALPNVASGNGGVMVGGVSVGGGRLMSREQLRNRLRG